MPNLGGTEILVIAVVAFLLFGAGSLPKFARGVGDALREFKRAAHDLKEPVADAKRDADVLAREIKKS